MNGPKQLVDDDSPTLTFERPRQRPTAASTGAADGLWDANDVASYLKVSRSWVYHRAEAGQLPCVRVGGLLRFDPAVIRAAARGELAAARATVAFPARPKR